MVAEPDDAGFGRLTEGLCFCYSGFSSIVIARDEAISLLYRVAGFKRRPSSREPAKTERYSHIDSNCGFLSSVRLPRFAQ